MHEIHIGDINDDIYIADMLNIKIFKSAKDTYTIEVYRDKKVITSREVTTTNYLDVFEKLEIILKCEPECREAIENS